VTGAGAHRRRDRDLRTWGSHGLAHTSARADADRHDWLWTCAAAIAEMLDGKVVEWMEHVTDEQYGK